MPIRIAKFCIKHILLLILNNVIANKTYTGSVYRNIEIISSFY